MKTKEMFKNAKLSKEAIKIFVHYVYEFDLYKDFLAESAYSGLRDDVLGHITQKIEDSSSKIINKVEANEILKSLGSVKDLVKEFNVPPLVRIPLLGSMVGSKQVAYNVGLVVVLALICFIAYKSTPYLWARITNTEGNFTQISSQEENRSKWTITKADRTQDIEVRFPTKYMRSVYVYHGQNLKDNEVFIQFTGNSGYKIKTSHVTSSSPYGKMIVELYTDETPEAPYPTDEYDPNNEFWATGYQELIIFIPEQLNFKGIYHKYPLGQINIDGPKETLVEVYLEKGITPYVPLKRNEYDSNTTFGYAEHIKNAKQIGVELDYLGEYKAPEIAR